MIRKITQVYSLECERKQPKRTNILAESVATSRTPISWILDDRSYGFSSYMRER